MAMASPLGGRTRRDGERAPRRAGRRRDRRAQGALTDDETVGQEAALVASLDRRWGAALLDAGRVPDGIAGLRAGARYIATTWVEGEELSSAMRARGVDRRELALVVAHGVGRALDELHAIGVRHGDVKLANVLVTRTRPVRDRAEERGATLIDVGLAARVSGAAATGGTPRYLAPEVRRGEPATPAADLHALGIVLAELLEPTLAEADDPANAIAERASKGAAVGAGTPVGSVDRALLAPAPGARPSAAWLADRAASALDLARDDDELLAARRARIPARVPGGAQRRAARGLARVGRHRGRSAALARGGARHEQAARGGANPRRRARGADHHRAARRARLGTLDCFARGRGSVVVADVQEVRGRARRSFARARRGRRAGGLDGR